MRPLKTIEKGRVAIIFIAIIAISIVFVQCESQEKTPSKSSYTVDLLEKRSIKNIELTDSTKSRFNAEERAHFVKEKLKYYPPSEDYVVDAKFNLDTSYPVFQMPTTTDRKPNYRIFGYLHFSIHDTVCKLTIFQNMDYKDSPDYDGTVFIPFKDNTNEFGTYGGGRYLDIPIPKTEKIKVDFNLAYNPYCAYSDRWSCPMVPAINVLDMSVFAGEKTYK